MEQLSKLWISPHMLSRFYFQAFNDAKPYSIFSLAVFITYCKSQEFKQ